MNIRSGLSSKAKRKSAFLYSWRQVPTGFVATNGARLQNVVQLNRQKLFCWFGFADFFCKGDFSTKLESILLLLWHPYGECENWPEKIATANKKSMLHVRVPHVNMCDEVFPEYRRSFRQGMIDTIGQTRAIVRSVRSVINLVWIDCPICRGTISRRHAWTDRVTGNGVACPSYVWLCVCFFFTFTCENLSAFIYKR